MKILFILLLLMFGCNGGDFVDNSTSSTEHKYSVFTNNSHKDELIEEL